MLLYAAKGRWDARRKFQPRHFRMLTDALAPGQVSWTDDLSAVPHRDWALVVHAPGGYALSKSLAARHKGGLYVFDALSRRERRMLEAREGTLVLDLDWDPLIADEEIVAGLIQSLDRLGLDDSRIRLVHANQTARPTFEAHWRRHTKREPLRTLEFPASFALAVAYHHGRASSEEMTARLGRARSAVEHGAKGKLLASFNGHLRAQRLHLIAWMSHIGLLERAHVSMLGYSKGSWLLKRLRRGATLRPPADLQASLAKMPYADEIEADVHEIWRRLPMTLDLERDFRDRGYERVVWESPDPRYYDDSWFSVVVESHGDRPGVLHITEKVAKPMLNAHPFLALGGAHALAKLREYGFESFSPLFRESFDTWPHPKERFRLFLEELRRLAGVPEDEIRQGCLELWDRCEHNYRHFLGGGARSRLAASFQKDVLEQLA